MQQLNSQQPLHCLANSAVGDAGASSLPLQVASVWWRSAMPVASVRLSSCLPALAAALFMRVEIT
jgi:hypothetical protein